MRSTLVLVVLLGSLIGFSTAQINAVVNSDFSANGGSLDGWIASEGAAWDLQDGQNVANLPVATNSINPSISQTVTIPYNAIDVTIIVYLIGGAAQLNLGGVPTDESGFTDIEGGENIAVQSLANGATISVHNATVPNSLLNNVVGAKPGVGGTVNFNLISLSSDSPAIITLAELTYQLGATTAAPTTPAPTTQPVPSTQPATTQAPTTPLVPTVPTALTTELDLTTAPSRTVPTTNLVPTTHQAPTTLQAPPRKPAPLDKLAQQEKLKRLAPLVPTTLLIS